MQPLDERPSSTSYIVAIIALLVLLGVGLFILTRLLSDGSGAADQLAVPDLANLTQDDAINTFTELGFRVRLRSVPSTSVAEGFVIDTDPAAGTQVDEGSTVEVRVSAGPEQFPIPQVIGLTEEAARSLIEEQGFVVGNVANRFSAEVEEGLVIEQDPDAGDAAPPGTAVDLVLSGGPFALTVPDVSGLTRDAAVSQLQADGFEVDRRGGVLQRRRSKALSSAPSPEQASSSGGTTPIVTVFVSQGPEPIPLPSFVGLTIEDARDLAAGLGSNWSSATPSTSPTPAGWPGSSPSRIRLPNTEVTVNDTVEVRLGQCCAQVTVPDLSGLTESQARTLVQSQGLDLLVIGEIQVDPGSGLVGRVAGQDPGPRC